MKHRVMYVGDIPQLYEKEGYAEPDELAHVHGSMYEGAWYFEPDDKSLLDEEDWGGFIVDESDLSFGEDA